MKKKIIALFLLLTSSACVASKDSTLIFKAAIGINYNKILAYDFYKNKRSGYSSGYDSAKIENASSYFPLIRISMEKMTLQDYGLSVMLTYNQSKFGYTYYTESHYNYAPNPTTGYSTHETKITNTKIISHSTLLSIGSICKIKKCYIIPKVNFNCLFNKNQIHNYYEKKLNGVLTIDENTNDKMVTYLLIGTGINMGYNFSVKNVQFYIEYQLDYYEKARFYLKNNSLNTSFCIGLKIR